ncbi:MAG: CCA tRNA nucleotidyltransferase [Proteobacteria bacterium]|nr:CCA tRNA nucleotidyltransferase [Pseudomonadota bacterium]
MENIIDKLKSLAKEDSVRMIVDALGAGADLHFVGGIVRDSISGKENSDIDLASVYLPEQICPLLESHGIKVIPTGIKHNTVTAVFNGEIKHIEITTFRNFDVNGNSVTSKNILEDLKFRDFTINSIAYSLNSEQIIDPNSGINDIKQRLIRAVGMPLARFKEDPLRILRMVRFSCSENYQIEEDTLKAATELCDCLSSVSMERIRDELVKILISSDPAKGFRLLHKIGFLKLFLPEIFRYVDFEQNQFHKADLFEHTLEVMSRTPRDLLLRLTALLHDVAKPDTLSIDPQTQTRHFYKHETVGVDVANSIMRRYKFSNEIIANVSVLIATHMRPIECGAGGMRRILRDTAGLFEQWRIFKEADALSCNVDEKVFLSQLSVFDEQMSEVLKGPAVSPLKSLAINGSDLLKLGIKEGPQIGEILRKLHEIVLDNPEYNNPEKLQELLLKIRNHSNL